MSLKLLKEDGIQYDETNDISIHNHRLFTLNYFLTEIICVVRSVLFAIIGIIYLKNMIITKSTTHISHTADVCLGRLHIFPRAE